MSKKCTSFYRLFAALERGPRGHQDAEHQGVVDLAPESLLTIRRYFLNRGRHQEDKFRFHDKINSNIAMTYHLYGQDMDLTHHISCNYQQAAAYLE